MSTVLRFLSTCLLPFVFYSIVFFICIITNNNNKINFFASGAIVSSPDIHFDFDVENVSSVQEVILNESCIGKTVLISFHPSVVKRLTVRNSFFQNNVGGGGAGGSIRWLRFRIPEPRVDVAREEIDPDKAIYNTTILDIELDSINIDYFDLQTTGTQLRLGAGSRVVLNRIRSTSIWMTFPEFDSQLQATDLNYSSSTITNNNSTTPSSEFKITNCKFGLPQGITQNSNKEDFLEALYPLRNPSQNRQTVDAIFMIGFHQRRIRSYPSNDNNWFWIDTIEISNNTIDCSSPYSDVVPFLSLIYILVAAQPVRNIIMNNNNLETKLCAKKTIRFISRLHSFLEDGQATPTPALPMKFNENPVRIEHNKGVLFDHFSPTIAANIQGIMFEMTGMALDEVHVRKNTFRIYSSTVETFVTGIRGYQLFPRGASTIPFDMLEPCSGFQKRVLIEENDVSLESSGGSVNAIAFNMFSNFEIVRNNLNVTLRKVESSSSSSSSTSSVDPEKVKARILTGVTITTFCQAKRAPPGSFETVNPGGGPLPANFYVQQEEYFQTSQTTARDLVQQQQETADNKQAFIFRIIVDNVIRVDVDEKSYTDLVGISSGISLSPTTVVYNSLSNVDGSIGGASAIENVSSNEIFVRTPDTFTVLRGCAIGNPTGVESSFLPPGLVDVMLSNAQNRQADTSLVGQLVAGLLTAENLQSAIGSLVPADPSTGNAGVVIMHHNNIHLEGNSQTAGTIAAVSIDGGRSTAVVKILDYLFNVVALLASVPSILNTDNFLLRPLLENARPATVTHYTSGFSAELIENNFSVRCAEIGVAGRQKGSFENDQRRAGCSGIDVAFHDQVSKVSSSNSQQDLNKLTIVRNNVTVTDARLVSVGSLSLNKRENLNRWSGVLRIEVKNFDLVPKTDVHLEASRLILREAFSSGNIETVLRNSAIIHLINQSSFSVVSKIKSSFQHSSSSSSLSISSGSRNRNVGLLSLREQQVQDVLGFTPAFPSHFEFSFRSCLLAPSGTQDSPIAFISLYPYTNANVPLQIGLIRHDFTVAETDFSTAGFSSLAEARAQVQKNEPLFNELFRNSMNLKHHRLQVEHLKPDACRSRYDTGDGADSRTYYRLRPCVSIVFFVDEK